MSFDSKYMILSAVLKVGEHIMLDVQFQLIEDWLGML